jgi:hypothetical protein
MLKVGISSGRPHPYCLIMDFFNWAGNQLTEESNWPWNVVGYTLKDRIRNTDYKEINRTSFK